MKTFQEALHIGKMITKKQSKLNQIRTHRQLTADIKLIEDWLVNRTMEDIKIKKEIIKIKKKLGIK